ncbi:hypothetical protein IQ255_07890 [Pleurocapsales cyanobacterium LEGE 10410]|nr:hypothetical protein [Pleurocapsales cyanobacterium LEGE 10410]
MEDMMFGFLLFVLFYGFFGWLFFVPAEAHDSDAESAWEMNRSGEIVVRHQDGRITTVEPIESQLKDLLWDNTEEVTETVTVTEVQQKPIVEELLDGVQVENITLRKARKIASRLGLRQKVNGKDQPKAWLVAQIAKRLETEPQVTAAVIKQVCDLAA